MVQQVVGYVAATVPAKTVRVSHTTLFHVAAQEWGEALQWTAIAALNGLTDPWITPLTTLLIPPVVRNIPPTGILGE